MFSSARAGRAGRRLALCARQHRCYAMLSRGREPLFPLMLSTEDSTSPLRRDVKMMGKMLGGVIKSQDERVYNSVQSLRGCARKWRDAKDAWVQSEQFGAMVKEVKTYDPERLQGVARAFTHFLALSNSAENVHKVRRMQQHLQAGRTNLPLPTKDDSFAGCIQRLLGDTESGNSDTIVQALNRLKVEIVLTAHPTEVNRRTSIRKHQNIARLLQQLDSPSNLPHKQRRLEEALEAEILSIWESDELRRSKPSPVEEAMAGLTIVENVLWHAVPSYLRNIDDVTQQLLDFRIPLDTKPLAIATWMGGDRDGNPNVTPLTTVEVALRSRALAVNLFKKDIKHLKQEMSMVRATDEMHDWLRDAGVTGEAKDGEPYRAVLRLLEQRLEDTGQWTDKLLGRMKSGELRVNDLKPHKPCLQGRLNHTSELMQPLMMLHRSLQQTGNKVIASGAAGGRLEDTIRRLTAFGLSLLPIDIRQESAKHSEVLDAVTRHLGAGSYLEWSETERRDWLTEQLQSKRPLLPRNVSLQSLQDLNPVFNDTVIDTLGIFEVAAALGDGSLGAYVISQCQQASDVLAVALLQQDAGVQPAMRVVPLFETLDDLERSSATLQALLDIPEYLHRIEGEQEIMVGYSDSAKDAGRLASSWAQYVAQEDMVAIANKKEVELTFFHGKGGTVGRGGNPALYRAIIAHPPGTINGRFRVTEQGEMITQNFGEVGMAERTLDLMLSGVMAEQFEARPEPKPEWRECMARLSAVSCAAYRKVVREEPRFVPYFRAATPEQDLADLNIGSRPAKRNPKGGVESLRAIPWVFAWTQTRFNLPAWLGVGEALESESSADSDLPQEMYRQWPWFTTVVDLLEMILVKSERTVSENYDKQLVPPEERHLGRELRSQMVAAEEALLEVTSHDSLSSHQPVLLRSMNVRNPYVDPLNIIQAEILRRLREGSDTNALTKWQKKVLKDTLLITINGIANGMRNSG